MPLLDAFLLGVISLLSGASFLIPNKMSPVYRIPFALVCAALGILYIYISAFPMPEVDKAPLVRGLIAAMVGCMGGLNIGNYIVGVLKSNAEKKAGLPRRRIDDKR